MIKSPTLFKLSVVLLVSILTAVESSFADLVPLTSKSKYGCVEDSNGNTLVALNNPALPLEFSVIQKKLKTQLTKLSLKIASVSAAGGNVKKLKAKRKDLKNQKKNLLLCQNQVPLPTPSPTPGGSPTPTGSPGPTATPIPSGSPFTMHAHMDGAQAGTASSNSGDCTFVVNDTRSQIQIDCTHNVTDANHSHIHLGDPGVDGGIVCGLGVGTSPISDTCPVNASFFNNLLEGKLYINVHTPTFPNGEIRGQIYFMWDMSGAQEVPPVASGATGQCDAHFEDDLTAFDVHCSHNVSSPTAAELSEGAAGFSGALVCSLGSGDSPISANCALSSGQIDSLFSGNLYTNITSGSAPAGEIRGQIN